MNKKYLIIARIILIFLFSGCVSMPKTYIDFSKLPNVDLAKYKNIVLIPGLKEDDPNYPRLMELYQALHYAIWPKGYTFVSNVKDADAVVLIVFANWPDIQYTPAMTLPFPVWNPGTTTNFSAYNMKGSGGVYGSATTQGSYSTGYVSRGANIKEIRRLAVSIACYEKNSQKTIWNGSGMAKINYGEIDEGYRQIIKDIASKLPNLNVEKNK